MSFVKEIKNRILVLDGAMGTMIQRNGYFVENNESLNLTAPELIASIHREYIEAGADIISTNSFGANSIVQSRHNREGEAEKMAYRAACIARQEADRSDRRIYVAGSVGPTAHSLSIPSDAADPSYRKYDFDSVYSAYLKQIKALVEGGADIILVETCFDSLNAKAAVLALSELNTGIPVMISASVSDRSCRLLTGQTIEAFYHSVKHCPHLAAFGINCSLGSAEMSPMVREISSFSPLPLLFYPNAGMPDENGCYNETPEYFARQIAILAEEGCLNIAGGCCGTGPEHIRAVKAAVSEIAPRTPVEQEKGLVVCGLETVHIDRQHNFTNIGERTNVAGSKKFARLIAASDYSGAMKVARDQVSGGATVIDINMDDPMVDSVEKMRDFLRFVNSDPEVAKCAVMIDSSNWETVIEGLKNTQGKCIVNSISLRDGEEAFRNTALEISRYGAAMVVMAFDEKGQAVTYARKTEICRRSYEILTAIGIAPENIIFDCNVLTIGTGIPEHAEFGKAFIDSVSYIKRNLPGALTSGGISNLSFAFRGNNSVREAMHSVFLYHAINAGLDMAIVNPQMLEVYDSIEPDLRKCVEDVILNTDEAACDRLSAKASEIAASTQDGTAHKAGSIFSHKTPEDRLSDILVCGDNTELELTIRELLDKGLTPMEIVEGALMNGMETVGKLFECGKMFLPQVVRSAQLMHDAVDILKPYMDNAVSESVKPRFLIATVQGDVHDIGKNITSIVLQCSGFEVIDLGVMVPVHEILEKAAMCKADIIGVSGLITPSLSKMLDLCREMKRRNLATPLFVGGAATSELHTAVKLSREYEHVYYGSNASETAVLAKKCIASYEDFRNEALKKRNLVSELYKAGNASKSERKLNHPTYPSMEGLSGLQMTGLPYTVIDPSSLASLFNWKLFDLVCGCSDAKGTYGKQLADILDSGELSVRLCSKFFRAHRRQETIVFETNGRIMEVPLLRDCDSGFSMVDYFNPQTDSPLGIFGVAVYDSKQGSDDIIRHALKSVLAEAASEYIRRNALSLIDSAEHPGLKLIAPGIGYPCCPDHGLKRDVLSLLPQELGIELTETCAMIPEHSTCGFLILHPDAEYRDIRRVDRDSLDKYAASRSYDEHLKELFLGFLESH